MRLTPLEKLQCDAWLLEAEARQLTADASRHAHQIDIMLTPTKRQRVREFIKEANQSCAPARAQQTTK